MELKMFAFIDNVMREYERNQVIYAFAEDRIRTYFELIGNEAETTVVSLHTRIKTPESLKEKLLRNKFYLHFDDPGDVLMYLSDLIGITIECRFIRNEAEIYKMLFDHFPVSGSGFCVSKDDPSFFLNMHMPQPQIQRNGFTIYRIDGYYMYSGMRINFELQIKSLVHRFWSEIEHEVIYKNTDIVVFDHFMKDMLGAIRDNLDVVDRQLEIMYNELSDETRHAAIGMNQENFKILMASSINELVNRKMKESVGFSTDFKKCSSILTQYIYIRDFINSDLAREHMVDYLEHLNFLSEADLDFSSRIFMDRYQSEDAFCGKLGEYLQMMMNEDFEWHIFFVMLFAIRNEDVMRDFDDFLHVIMILLIQPQWYRTMFLEFEEEKAAPARDFMAGVLAEGLVKADTIEIIHEEKLYSVMNVFRGYVERIEQVYQDYDQFDASREEIRNQLIHDILRVFR